MDRLDGGAGGDLREKISHDGKVNQGQKSKTRDQFEESATEIKVDRGNPKGIPPAPCIRRMRGGNSNKSGSFCLNHSFNMIH